MKLKRIQKKGWETVSELGMEYGKVIFLQIKPDKCRILLDWGRR